jgi:hypothetical protein
LKQEVKVGGKLVRMEGKLVKIAGKLVKIGRKLVKIGGKLVKIGRKLVKMGEELDGNQGIDVIYRRNYQEYSPPRNGPYLHLPTNKG